MFFNDALNCYCCFHYFLLRSVKNLTYFVYLYCDCTDKNTSGKFLQWEKKNWFWSSSVLSGFPKNADKVLVNILMLYFSCLQPTVLCNYLKTFEKIEMLSLLAAICWTFSSKKFFILTSIKTIWYRKNWKKTFHSILSSWLSSYNNQKSNLKLLQREIKNVFRSSNVLSGITKKTNKILAKILESRFSCFNSIWLCSSLQKVEKSKMLLLSAAIHWTFSSTWILQIKIKTMNS